MNLQLYVPPLHFPNPILQSAIIILCSVKKALPEEWHTFPAQPEGVGGLQFPQLLAFGGEAVPLFRRPFLQSANLQSSRPLSPIFPQPPQEAVCCSHARKGVE
jgi:hypothetical protein